MIRIITARWDGKCAECGAPVREGDEIFYDVETREVLCAECGEPEYKAQQEDTDAEGQI